MVRYRTRDITRLSDEPCACGRTHRRILRITGRDDDMLIIRGVNVYPSQVEAVLVGLPGIAPHYQFVVSQDGPMTALRVEVEAAPRSFLTSGTLAEIKLDQGFLVAAVRRGEALFVPRGSDRIEAGDRLLFVTKTENARNLGRFLAE